MAPNLGLNEALITVNKSRFQKELSFYYQFDECYGCPSKELGHTSVESMNFVLETRFKLYVELREVDTSSRLSCRFDGLNLNSHGHYQIDVTESGNSSANNLECQFRTLNDGECLWCPFALLIFFVLSLTFAEKLYYKYNSKKARTSSRAASQDSQDATNQSSDAHETSQQQVDEAPINAVSRNDKLSPRSKLSSRIESLDAFRGMTIAGMIMVNYGGAGYSGLEHKPWDGITAADFVFPFFIFSMGASIALSTRAMMKRGKSLGCMLVKILRRSFILMALGLCLNSKWLNGSSLDHLRFTGVLQRFSISYLMVASMYSMEEAIDKWIRAQSLYRVPLMPTFIRGLFEIFTALNYLAIYIYVTFYVEYSANCPKGYLGPGGQTEAGRYANCTGGAAAWLDRIVLGGNHLYNDRELKNLFKTSITHDPEGLLVKVTSVAENSVSRLLCDSAPELLEPTTHKLTLTTTFTCHLIVQNEGFTTSILLTLIGLQCGKIIVRFKSHKSRLLMFLQWFIILAVGCVAVVHIPINKRLWSLTFVTITGAFAYLMISLLYLLMDVYNCQRTFFLRLIISAGKNSIFLYVAHSLLSGMLPWHFQVDETSHFQLLLRLCWATFVWLLVAHYMASKRLFITI